MPVTGITRVIFMIGDPVKQAQSPGLLNAELTAEGLDCVMVPVAVPPHALPHFIALVRAATDCVGFVATLPLKAALADCVDFLAPRAAQLGVVNVVRRDADGALWGDMTDGCGFWTSARVLGFDPVGRAVAIAGAGAAATAIAGEFFHLGGRAVSILTPQDEEFVRLRARFDGAVTRMVDTDLSSFDIVVNATPLGMDHTPGTPFTRAQLETLGKRAIVGDLITEPRLTRLLGDAADLGLASIEGKAMTAGQIGAIREVLMV